MYLTSVQQVSNFILTAILVSESAWYVALGSTSHKLTTDTE